MLQPLYEQMLAFLQMETEISFNEFQDYYKKVIVELENYKGYDEEQSFQALFIMDNLKANAESRAKRKFPETKKYNKMSERSQVWIEALFLQLMNLGFTEEQIKQKMEEMYETA